MEISRNALLTIVLLLYEICSSCLATKWLAISKLPQHQRIVHDSDCDKYDWLDRKQKTVCKRNLDMMDPIKHGAVEAIEQCQHQFAGRRWNCSTVDGPHILGRLLNYGTKESAFVHALSSAGVAYSVTRTCSSGLLDRCGCDRSGVPGGLTSEVMVRRMVSGHLQQSNNAHSQQKSRSVDLQWSGCSDNVAFGIALSRVFVDARERVRGKSAQRALINLHNNNAGRKVVEESMKVQCKCHGVSGSCEVKTCWRAMSPFRHIASILKEKFNAAVEVEEKLLNNARRELIPKIRGVPTPTETDLVYLVASPDFCEPDSKTGSLGTHMRSCNRTSTGMDGCELMCCGRGFYTKRTIVTERCHCKFHWCCSVRCQTCQIEKEEHFCK